MLSIIGFPRWIIFTKHLAITIKTRFHYTPRFFPDQFFSSEIKNEIKNQKFKLFLLLYIVCLHFVFHSFRNSFRFRKCSMLFEAEYSSLKLFLLYNSFQVVIVELVLWLFFPPSAQPLLAKFPRTLCRPQ